MTADMQTRLERLLLDWQEAFEAGREIAPADLCRDCPELLPELEKQISSLRRMNALVGIADSAAVSRTLIRTQCNSSDSTQLDVPLPVMPGYETLGELGRGGMGVVYKARQLKLNRLVALKVILAGAHAGPEATARFLQEAETIARLKHANIVQIYDYGSHDSNAFFSLEYLEGGSLADRLRGEPQPAKESARLVETLARTIQFAHDQGIVHRDLKPANILIAADGTPKVTDFGLAKQLDSAMTASGAILGTPSYMAPEQAKGKIREIGPAADVYALGAILYEMLTGRPPFKGVSAWDTVQLVIGSEPVPPRQLNAHVPRDLETICLSCLHKDVAKRYASASMLAEDLRRYQAGEPIMARPVGAVERAWRWCRRNQLVASLILLYMTLLFGTLLSVTLLYFRAEHQRDLAVFNAEKALAEKRRAQAEAEKATKISKLLVGMFESSDPLGLSGISYSIPKATGEKLTAREILDRGAARIEADKDLSPLVRAALLDTVGNVYRSLGQHVEAERLLQAALDLREKTPGADPLDMAASFHNLAWLHHERGNYERALTLYQDALKIRQQQDPPSEELVGASQLNLAWVLTEMRQYDEAETLLKNLIDRRRDFWGDEHRETCFARLALATVYFDSQRIVEGYALAQKGIEPLLKLDGNQSMSAAFGKFQTSIMQSFVLRDHAGAEASMEECLAITKKTLGERHLYVGLVRYRLAAAQTAQKKWPEAEVNLRECVAIGRIQTGIAHPKVAVAVDGLAAVLRQRGKGREATELFEELLQAQADRFGVDHVLRAETLIDFAEHLDKTGPAIKRFEVLQESIRIFHKAPTARPRLAESLNLLGVALYRAKDFGKAEECYREAIKVERSLEKPRPARLARQLNNLANSLFEQGQANAELKKQLDETTDLCKALSGEDRRIQLFDAELLQSRWHQHHKQPVEAAERISEAAQLAGNDSFKFYRVACAYAKCMPLVAGDENETDRYAKEAMAFLTKAVENGFKNRKLLTTEAALEPLRTRPEFKALLGKI